MGHWTETLIAKGACREAVEWAKFPKPDAAADRAARRRARAKADRAGSREVRARSGGRCEVFIWRGLRGMRCYRRAVHVHHLLSGNGVRGRGDSAKAEHKLHVCVQCHLDIHARRLVRDLAGWRREGE